VGPEGPEGREGPQGEEGPAGTGGFSKVVVITAHGGGGEPADATCPKEAPLAISGGGAIDNKSGAPGEALEISAPLTGHELSEEGLQPNGWRVVSKAGKYTAYVICAVTGKPQETPEEK
jgi:hypothetical protein